jgi:hypothetical protein
MPGSRPCVAVSAPVERSAGAVSEAAREGCDGSAAGAGPAGDGRSAALAIAGVVLLSATLFAPAPAVLLPGWVALLLLVLAGQCPWRRWLRLAWRLKWFHLSLLIFYGLLHPGAGGSGGEPLLGLQEAGLRIAALVMIVGWVVWWSRAFVPAAQVRGIAVWLRPLGLRGERFARRLFLALRLYEEAGRQGRVVPAGGSGRAGWLRAAREVLIDRLDRALDPAGMPPAVGGTTEQGGPPVRCRACALGLLWVAVVASVAASRWLTGA